MEPRRGSLAGDMYDQGEPCAGTYRVGRSGGSGCPARSLFRSTCPSRPWRLAGIVFIGRDIPKFLRIFLVMLSAGRISCSSRSSSAPASGAHHGRLHGLCAAALRGARRNGLRRHHLRALLRPRRAHHLPHRRPLSRFPGRQRHPHPLHRSRAGSRGRHRHLDDRHPHRDQSRPGRPQRPPQLLLARHVQCARGQGCRGLLVSALRRSSRRWRRCSWPSR